uniref:hypothetical protein n=1 Tax=Luteolibacter marinus TaxID=2776705 RepID=UPI00186828F6
GASDAGPGSLGSALIPGGAAGGTLVVNFTVPDFTADTEVGFEVFFNGASRGSGSFPWTDTDSNYIGLDARGAFVNFEGIAIATHNPAAPAISLLATPTSVSAGSTLETITLDWEATAVPAGATYRITADKAVSFPNPDDTGSAGSPDGSGSVAVNVDGTLGEVELAIELLDGTSAVVARSATKVFPVAPEFHASQTAVRFNENSTSEFLTLSIDTFANFPSGATYEISDDNNAAVSYFGPTSDAAVDPLFIDLELDPSQGPVTFTLLLKDSQGVVFDTVTYTVASARPAPVTLTNLFSDDFGRFTGDPAMDEDIDSSNAGMTGLLAPADPPVDFYREVFEGSGAPSSMQITTFSSLAAAYGPGMSCWSINHNFTDSQIAADGAFSIAFDAVVISSGANDQPDRYIGFGLGMSEAEVTAMVDESNITGYGPRGAVFENVSRGTSDFHVSVAETDMVQIFANGILVGEHPVDGNGLFGTGGVATPAVRIRADVAFADPVTFAAGSFAYYTVYCDNLSVASGYFQLTQSGENHVGFSARAANSTELDNLVIATVAAADMPYPGDPADPLPALAVTAADPAGAIDLQLSGAPGVRYEIEKSPDLISFDGIGAPGAGIPGFPSATRHGVADGSGLLALPAVAPPAGFEAAGFYRGKSFHWPAP